MIEPLPPGRARLIGPYQLLGLLGAGGMGEVYLARPAGSADPLGGLVALKTVRAELDLDDGFRIRFRREIDAAGAVRSPHTAALVGGDAGGRLPWLATEYVPGPSLAEAVIRGGPMPEPVVREMGAGLAHALADMHAVRVLHRDLKPGNVLLGADGPKVIDFGIAQAFDATQLTRTGVVVGSPGYISPEHVNGSRALVPASDVFCLGAVLAFAATGRGPFDDSDMAAVIFRIAQGEAELSGVPPQLRAVIEECLHRDAGARPTPRQLAGMLLSEGRAAGEPFPWTDAIRGQLAEHAAGARAVVEAAAPSAAAPPVPSGAPHPGGPALAPTPVVPVAVPGDRQGNKGLWIALAAAATAVCVVLGAVLLPGLFEGDGGGDDKAGGAGGGGAQPTASASDAVRTKAGPAVIPGADAGRTGDFGTAAADVSGKPAGWQPWHVRIANGRVECVIADTSLVCGGPERITVLDAANGKQRWQTGPGRAGTGPASVAAVIGTTVYAFDDGALVALGLADGAEKWREPLAGGARVTDSVQSAGVLYYATRTTGTGAGRIFAHQLTGTHTRKWDKPWDDAADEGELLLADGRLVAVGDAVTVLKSTDGEQSGSTGPGDVTCRTPVLKGRALLCTGPSGLTVVDVAAPQNRRTVADGVDIAYRPAVTRDGTVVLSTEERVYAFGLADGRQSWATPEPVDYSGAPVIVGDHAYLVTENFLESYEFTPGGRDIPVATKRYNGWPEEPIGGVSPGSISLLAMGDVLFLSFEDGRVLSGYAP
ncbi:serine/threonine-protein kinase [Streptomyces sp. NBC_00053]|uniref:serine/threonine-protein kinase n=1 Tax=unclassified Streptomyces TaxID=2593676 RepID=UPI00225A6B9F|nr:MULTISPECIES: serine/threonine-protein kinase [unclassified Streptomyces]MCX5503266.1 serine/threonine-protein kinase [Streptomyces sp. NBC_00052]MCX5548199.1 serine/threonine-protein kinase [Streptomyces sp. NBC_00051]WSG53430.1 serine/threonine-protein kinase [Streptomyces sp. NBC_01732]